MLDKVRPLGTPEVLTTLPDCTPITCLHKPNKCCKQNVPGSSHIWGATAIQVIVPTLIKFDSDRPSGAKAWLSVQVNSERQTNPQPFSPSVPLQNDSLQKMCDVYQMLNVVPSKSWFSFSILFLKVEN